MKNFTRRSMLALAMTTALVGTSLLGTSIKAQAADDLIIGGSIPLTGVFAFAGVGLERGMQDYIKLLNEDGGIAGRKVRLAYEDTAYKVDASVAAFNKLTGQNDIHLYYGDSTGFAKTINAELDRSNKVMMAGASFATELNNPAAFPNQFIAGPDYSQMTGILLEHIAKEKPGAKIALINSDTEFGRDPIAATKARAEELGLKVVEEIITAPGSVDVSTEILKLRRARPDYAICHGYVLAPVPEFMSQARELGLQTKFMGTFWSMDNSLWNKVGEVADGYMGVMPYNYHYDDSAGNSVLNRLRSMREGYQSTAYMQGVATTMLFAESAKRVLDAGKELTGPNLKAALGTITNFDTGGVFGKPISVTGNTVPLGRVYRYSASDKKMLPASDWIDLGE